MLAAGDRATVRLVKPGKGDVAYQVAVIADDGNHLVAQAPWSEPEPRDVGFVRFEPGDVFTEHYWRDRWYSIKEVRDHASRLKGWYCDVARPMRVEDGVIVSEDLVLDLWVSGDRRTILRLDEDEFEAIGLAKSDPAAADGAVRALDELERHAQDEFALLSHNANAAREAGRSDDPGWEGDTVVAADKAARSDAIFNEPRLAAIYDALDPDRSDLDAYVAMVDELGARSVLDLGCGTGVFALQLAERGLRVIGADPSAASLEVARAKPGAERVTWIHGDATAIPAEVSVDAVTMTANVAQVFLTDAEWLAALAAIRAALRAGGWLIFESRDPARRAWEEWTEDQTRSTTDIPGVGRVTDWVQVTDVAEGGELVTFESPNIFEADGTIITSRSTLRFRTREAIEASLHASGFAVDEVRDAPDRPGRELVFVARRLPD